MRYAFDVLWPWFLDFWVLLFFKFIALSEILWEYFNDNFRNSCVQWLKLIGNNHDDNDYEYVNDNLNDADDDDDGDNNDHHDIDSDNDSDNDDDNDNEKIMTMTKI